MMVLNTSNYDVFRECFSSAFLQRVSTGPRLSRKSRKKGRHRRASPISHATDANIDGNHLEDGTYDTKELADFIEYLASSVFESLPDDLKSLSFAKLQDDPILKDRYDPNDLSLTTSITSQRLLECIPPSVSESVSVYDLLTADTSFPSLFTSALSEYVTSIVASPPVWSSTRTSECEICGRDWVPLTYHHLIPRSMHDKARKRNWHDERILNSVAWLCRACHSFIHRCASNEELAKEFYTVDLLAEREDVQKWSQWAGTIRWKSR